ncbi:hypothetical protein HY633_01070 [Candidatus Uhrbacteria bacterium]|nr:hypothetical protein [Candidatus Uhrbacteria bacterium]
MALERVKARVGTGVKLLPAVIVLVVVGYAAAGYFLLILPRWRLIAPGGELDLQRVQELRNSELGYAALVGAAVGDHKALNPELKERVSAALPPEKDIPGIIASLAALAELHGMVLVNFDAVVDDKTALPTGEKVVAVTMNLTGADYPGFKAFLADIERSLRIFDVQSLVFSPKTASYSMTMSAYYLDAK